MRLSDPRRREPAHRLRSRRRGRPLRRRLERRQRRRRHPPRPELGPGHTIVTILCDSGTRYQSRLFNPALSAVEVAYPCPPGSQRPAPRLPSVFSATQRSAEARGQVAAILAGLANFCLCRYGRGTGVPARPPSRSRNGNGEGNVLNTAKKWIVDTDWLAEHLDAPDLVVFDGKLAPADRQARPQGRVPRRAHSRRAVLRHRRPHRTRSRRCRTCCPPPSSSPRA